MKKAKGKQFCKCGCGEEVTRGKWKRGHVLRSMSKRKLHARAVQAGAKGGAARAERLSKAKRREIAMHGGLARHERPIPANLAALAAARR